MLKSKLSYWKQIAFLSKLIFTLFFMMAAAGNGNILYSSGESGFSSTSQHDIQSCALLLITPNGNEVLCPGQRFKVRWQSDPKQKRPEYVKLEYSVDNGSCYQTIRERFPNTHLYQWVVPHHVSNKCRFRISPVSRLTTNPVPEHFLFDVSSRPFKIRYKRNLKNNVTHRRTILHRRNRAPALPGSHIARPTPSRSKRLSGKSTAQSTGATDTYYIYSFDNKLMAEYDHTGTCTKNYLWLGNRLLAVYFPQTDTYRYHMTDQVNSTRIVTDDNGNVVHSAAYDPYGEPQKTWTNTYKPRLKFSGKERETYSGLDYFGARYYDSGTYRFNSVDPIMNRAAALVNPQLWNLYTYSRNSPITYYDPDGRQEVSDNAELEMWENGYGVRTDLNSEINTAYMKKAAKQAYDQAINGHNWLLKDFYGDERVWVGPDGQEVSFAYGVMPSPYLGKVTELKSLMGLWTKGRSRSIAASIRKHAAKHGNGMTIMKYLRKAKNFNYKGAKSSGYRSDGSILYTRKSGEYIIKRNGKIVSYGQNR